jgi:hypothetical protein
MNEDEYSEIEDVKLVPYSFVVGQAWHRLPNDDWLRGHLWELAGMLMELATR